MKINFLNKIILFFIVGIVVFIPNNLNASGYQIYIKGNQTTTVTKPYILLSDVAQITSVKQSFDDVAIGIGKIEIAKSPEPNKETKIEGSTIVSKLRNEGVRLDEVGYVFPKYVVVKRAGRALTQKEIETAIFDYMSKKTKDITISNISYDKQIFVSPDDINIFVENAKRDSEIKKRMIFNLAIKSKDNKIQKAKAYALINEWTEVPLANRPIRKGEVVRSNDFVMARINLAKLPKNSFDEEQDVIGKETTKNISKGEIFLSSSLKVPPVIREGEKVKIEYKSNLLVAIATGIAVEEGGVGERIRVKNESSNKIIEANVVENGLVKVGQEF